MNKGLGEIKIIKVNLIPNLSLIERHKKISWANNLVWGQFYCRKVY